MQGLQMIPVARVNDAFHARVLVARLGSEGIVTQVRGGIDTLYPTGTVEVLVSAADLDSARELLLADDVESAFDDDDDYPPGPTRPRLARWAVVMVVVALVLFAYVNTLAFPG